MAFTIPNLADAAFPEQAEIDSQDIRILRQGTNRAGVISGCGATAQGTPNMTVAVGAGSVRWLETSANVAAGNVTIEPADGTNARFDLIQATAAGALVNPTAGDGKGIADPEPVFPVHLTNRIVLAAVYIPALDAAIESNQIIDKRVTLGPPYVELVHPEQTGLVRLIDRSTTDENVANTTVEGSLYSFSIPGGSIGVRGGIRVSVGGQYINNTGYMRTGRFRLKLGASTGMLSGYCPFQESSLWRKWSLDFWILNCASESSQNWAGNTIFSAPLSADFAINQCDLPATSLVGAGKGTTAENTAGARTLDVRWQHGYKDSQLVIYKLCAFAELLSNLPPT